MQGASIKQNLYHRQSDNNYPIGVNYACKEKCKGKKPRE